MGFCKNRKFIFVHIPKNAGTSVEHYLNLINRQSGYGIVNGKARQHWLWHDYKKHFGDKYEDYFKFAICRNPYTRFVSEYHWCEIPGKGKRGGQTVDQFITFCTNKVRSGRYGRTVFDDHIIPQWKYAYKPDGTCMVDHIARFEKLINLVNLLKKRYNIAKPFPKKHKQGGKKITLTAQQKNRIYNIYKKDFELFGYNK